MSSQFRSEDRVKAVKASEGFLYPEPMLPPILLFCKPQQQNGNAQRLRETCEPNSQAGARVPKLLNPMREAMQDRYHSGRTLKTHCQWDKCFVLHHNVRHSEDIGEAKINTFLTHLPLTDTVSASTQSQAFSAHLILYREVIEHEAGNLGDRIRARTPKRLRSNL